MTEQLPNEAFSNPHLSYMLSGGRLTWDEWLIASEKQRDQFVAAGLKKMAYQAVLNAQAASGPEGLMAVWSIVDGGQALGEAKEEIAENNSQKQQEHSILWAQMANEKALQVLRDAESRPHR